MTPTAPIQLDLFETPTCGDIWPGPPSSATVRHAAVALRCAGTVDRVAAIARAVTPSRPNAGGYEDGIAWETTAKGIAVTQPPGTGSCSTFTWRALDGALAASLTPALCSAIAAWSARWCSMHAARPYIDQINGHQIYRWSTYLYVTDLATAIEHDVQTAAVERLVAA